MGTLLGLFLGIVLSFKSQTVIDQKPIVTKSPALRPFAYLILCGGIAHYGISLLAWGFVLYAFGIRRDTYEFWFRDALPALTIFICFLTSLGITFRRPNLVWWWAGALACLCVGHFVLDNSMHHFTINSFGGEDGCVWGSPTWWWYEHRCSVWCN